MVVFLQEKGGLDIAFCGVHPPQREPEFVTA